MSGAARERVLEGERALERADWATARTQFEDALADEESAAAYEGLGLALWFLGRIAEGITCRERAFAAHVREGRCDDAARVAVWISHQHMIGGRPSAARGWLSRAERAVEHSPRGPGQGWVAVEKARHTVDVSAQAAHAALAIDIARESGEDDLEVFGLSLLGRVEVSTGRGEPGLKLLEEAMAAATAGRVRNVHTLAEAYCNLVMACAAAGEWERAAEWCQHVESFAQSKDAAPLFGACRTVHADVLLATGRWAEAEDALGEALAVENSAIPELSAPAVASLAELRIHQGRLAEAERILAGREEHPAALRALALLRVAEDRPRVAVALLERGLAGVEGDAMRTSALLAALADARLAAGDVAGAATPVDQLAGLATESGVRLVVARAHLAAARVALASGDHGVAAERSAGALREFSTLRMPLDVAQARLELARSATETEPEVAVEEARAAHTVFRELGAARPMDAAARLLRDLGGRGGARRRTSGPLTAREQEVLDLVTLGMSNARIARTLLISEKTAGHHVSRILTKLGVHNRAEAAAQAVASRQR